MAEKLCDLKMSGGKGEHHYTMPITCTTISDSSFSFPTDLTEVNNFSMWEVLGANIPYIYIYNKDATPYNLTRFAVVGLDRQFTNASISISNGVATVTMATDLMSHDRVHDLIGVN